MGVISATILFLSTSQSVITRRYCSYATTSSHHFIHIHHVVGYIMYHICIYRCIYIYILYHVCICIIYIYICMYTSWYIYIRMYTSWYIYIYILIPSISNCIHPHVEKNHMLFHCNPMCTSSSPVLYPNVASTSPTSSIIIQHGIEYWYLELS